MNLCPSPPPVIKICEWGPWEENESGAMSGISRRDIISVQACCGRSDGPGNDLVFRHSCKWRLK